MAGIGRNRLVGENRKVLLRNQDRSNRVIQPRAVHHTSQLPPAREYVGRVMYVGGITKALYFSNGTTWTEL